MGCFAFPAHFYFSIKVNLKCQQNIVNKILFHFAHEHIQPNAGAVEMEGAQVGTVQRNKRNGTERTGNEFLNHFHSKKRIFSVKFNGDSFAIHYVERGIYIHGISASQTKYEIQ